MSVYIDPTHIEEDGLSHQTNWMDQRWKTANVRNSPKL